MDHEHANPTILKRQAERGRPSFAAAGILTQYFSGVEGFPLIPPGPIILLVAATLVAFGPWRWTPAVGVVAPLFVLVGGAIATIANWGIGALSDKVVKDRIEPEPRGVDS